MKLASIDLETHLVQSGLGAPPIVVGSVSNNRGSFLLEPSRFLAWLRGALEDQAQHFVGCNVAYDFVCAMAADPSLTDLVFAAYEAGRVHDVAIREALIDIAKGDLLDSGDEGIGIRYGLGTLVFRYLGIDISADKSGPDAWRKKYALLHGVPIEEWEWAARVYPLRDTAFPLAIYRAQEGGENLHDEANQNRAALALSLMEVWGMRTNRAAYEALRAKIEATDAANTKRFQAVGIIRENGTENKKRVAELVTAAYGGKPPMTAPSAKFPQGQVAGDRDTLSESGDPLLESYATAGKNDKYLTTYLPILQQGLEVPWLPSFNVLVATTRVSSDAQQFPQQGGVRECIEARPGHVLCSVDFAGLELRTMAQRALYELGFSKMAEVLNTGADPHLMAAAGFLGIEYGEAKRRYKAGEPLLKIYRDLGKIWNFGKGGGMGPAAMVFNARKGNKGDTTKGPDGHVYVGTRFCLLAGKTKRCGARTVLAKVQRKERRICADCLDVAKSLDAGWLRAWPEQAALFSKASKLTKTSRYVVATIPGSNVKRGKCSYTQWLNTPFQGLGAAAAKRAMWLVCREMYTDRSSPLWRCRLLLNVHDELIAEFPIDRAPEAGDRMAKIMRDALADFVPDLAASVEAEPALSFTMTKRAQTVRDEYGRLQIWREAA